MRASRRATLVIAAFLILGVGVWAAVRNPTLSRSAVTYGTDVIGTPFYEQLPLRIGIAVVSSAFATVLVMIAVRRGGTNQAS